MSNYFKVCFIIQLVLLIANLLAQSVLAAKNAMTAPGQPKRAKSVLLAALRGLVNLELAYQEWWKKRSAEDYSQEAMQRHTTTVLYYKLTELVFEAPQVLLSWTVLLLRVTADYMLKLLPHHSPGQVSSETDSAVWLWVFQAVSAGFGLVSLSIAAMEFMRLHPQSAWASSKPPSRLLFGLIDVGTSAWQSPAVGLFAFFSLLNRSLMYMMCTQFWGVTVIMRSDRRSYPQEGLSLLLAFVIIPVSSLSLNVLLLLGIRSWFILPAAVISMFINIPWATGRSVQFRTSRWSSWPAWVMEFVYCGATAYFVTLAFFRMGQVYPLGAARSACSTDSIYNGAIYFGIGLGFTVVAAVIWCADLLMFLAMAGWQSDRRRRYYKQHGSTEHMAADLDIAVDLPVSFYKVSGMYAVLCNPVESKDLEQSL